LSEETTITVTVIDTETTGLDPAVDRVVQIAAVELRRFGKGNFAIGVPALSLVNPGIPIPPQASGVHHIVDEDVSDAPSLVEAVALSVPLNPNPIAAHNARFDRQFLPMLRDRPWIDTYRCAMHLYPDAPDYKVGTLFYYLGCGRLLSRSPHSAPFDARLAANILARMLDEAPLEELIRLSTKAVKLRTILFGKHANEKWADVPSSYLKWILEKSAKGDEFEPDVVFTAKKLLQEREERLPL